VLTTFVRCRIMGKPFLQQPICDESYRCLTLVNRRLLWFAVEQATK
jgi:hypothetical protein